MILQEGVVVVEGQEVHVVDELVAEEVTEGQPMLHQGSMMRMTSHH